MYKWIKIVYNIYRDKQTKGNKMKNFSRRSKKEIESIVLEKLGYGKKGESCLNKIRKAKIAKKKAKKNKKR